MQHRDSRDVKESRKTTRLPIAITAKHAQQHSRCLWRRDHPDTRLRASKQQSTGRGEDPDLHRIRIPKCEDTLEDARRTRRLQAPILEAHAGDRCRSATSTREAHTPHAPRCRSRPSPSDALTSANHTDVDSVFGESWSSSS